MNRMTEGMLFNIQHFSIHDGPGIRTTVFFKGCNLRCYWCHNPESWRMTSQIQYIKERCIGCGECGMACPNGNGGQSARFTDACMVCGTCTDQCYAEAVQVVGKRYKVDEVMGELLRDRDYYESSGGGVTFSGGEPFLQSAFLKELLEACKDNGMHTAVESALCVEEETLLELLPWIDLVLCDIKSMDEQDHRRATGQSNQKILKNIRIISRHGKEMILRTPVIPGFNDNIKAVQEIAAFIASLPQKHSLELLPFRDLCSGKYESMHLDFQAAGLKTPKDERMLELADAVKSFGVSCSMNTPF